MDQAALMLTISGRVSETQQIVATQFNFRLRTPDLIIKVHRATQSIKQSFQVISHPRIWHCSFFLFVSFFLGGWRGCGRGADDGRDFFYEPTTTRPEGSGIPCGGTGPSYSSNDSLWVRGKYILYHVLFFPVYLVYLLWLSLPFPALPSGILVVMPLCLWLSNSSPLCPDQGNYWPHWTASSSHKYTEWPRSLCRKKSTEAL